MKPDIWGKYLWVSIHFIAMEYPHNPTIDEKNNYRTFFENLEHVLPCAVCSENYSKHLIKFPLNDNVLQNRMNLFKWTVDIHNEVNKLTGKSILSYDHAIKLYTEFFVNKNDTIKQLFHTPYNGIKSSSSYSVLKNSVSTPELPGLFL